jgi:DNA-binding response OmpR family regulator
MDRILIVTPARSRFAEFAAGLVEKQAVQVAWADDGRAALADVMRHTPLAVVVDEALADMPGLALVRRLIPINAMIQTAVVSTLSPDVFHEASEGLGVMAQLPLKPASADAAALLDSLARLKPKSLGMKLQAR